MSKIPVLLYSIKTRDGFESHHVSLKELHRKNKGGGKETEKKAP